MFFLDSSPVEEIFVSPLSNKLGRVITTRPVNFYRNPGGEASYSEEDKVWELVGAGVQTAGMVVV